MSHSDSIARLCSLLKPTNDARPTFLFGAGASFSSGIPLAAESVRRIARRVYADRMLQGKALPDQIKLSEWMDWLQKKPWFINGEDRLAENFPLIIEHELTPSEYRRLVLTDLTLLGQDIGPGYRAYSELVLRGLAATALTTNFDICLPKALNDKRPHIRSVSEVNRSPGDFNEYNVFSRAQIVWLHGKTEQYTDRNLVSETQTLAPDLVQKLIPLLEDTPLVVVGYRGAEPSIMQSLLGEETGLKFRHGIYWCALRGETLHPNVEALAARLGSNFKVLEIEGFDELFVSLNRELAGVQRFAPPSAEAVRRYDDLPVKGATWADVDFDLALMTLREYCAKLERGTLESQNLKTMMRELGLLVPDNANEVPSVACILLFGRDPTRFFPHAVVSVTVAGKKRKVFSGNLLSQRNSVLEWFEEEEVNPSLKVKGRRQHETKLAYPERALVELLVNLLVHRDYEIQQSAEIESIPNHSMRFVNPGAAMPMANNKLAIGRDGVFVPVPQFSDLRNRALCDIFFGISAMERSGTGLTDASQLAAEAGGGTTFAYPPGRDSFSAELFRIEASAGSNSVARDTRPVGTYVLNLLPFAVNPPYLTHVELGISTWDELEKNVHLHEVGTFVFEARTRELWTFLPAVLANQLFADVKSVDARSIPLTEIESDRVLHAKYSWLMRKHFETHIKRFEDRGLIIEKDKKGHLARRAYFTANKKDNRTIIYDTPLRSGVRRDVVKRREGKLPWFECEGFGYEVVRQAGVWGVRIKPFYMFAKSDGSSPLPGYMRASKSTRRIKFDRNANVDSDLTFWARFLSEGAQTINIGNRLVGDLVLEGAFATVDVQEGGLTDGISAENRRSA